MGWAWGPHGGGVSVAGAVAPFVTAAAACGGVGGAGGTGGVVVGGAVVGVGVPVVVSDRAWAWGPVHGGGGPRPRDVRGAVPGKGASRLPAGALGSPVWRPGGLRQEGFGLPLLLWPWPCGLGRQGGARRGRTTLKRMMMRKKWCSWGMPVAPPCGLGAALRASAVSAAASAVRMEGISSGCGLGEGGWRGLAATWRPRGPIWLAAVCGGGVGLRTLLCRFGWAGLMQSGRACASASAGGTVHVGCIRASGGLGLGSRGCARGACAGQLVRWMCRGAWSSSRWVRLGCRLWGAAQLAWRGDLWRACVGVRADRGGPCRGGGILRVGRRVWVTGWGEGREGQGVWGWVRVRCVGVRVRLQRCACAVSCRPGGLEEELPVFRGRGEDFAEACAYFVYLLVRGGKRVLQRCAKAHAPEDTVDGVVPAGEGVLWPGGGVPSVCWGGRHGPDPGLCSCGRPASLDPVGQAEHGQSQVVACPPRGEVGQGAGWG